MIKKSFIFILTVLCGCLLAAIESPDQFLGFALGADRNVAHYDQIKAYLLKAGEESDRVDTFIVGKTTQNHDLALAVISAPENLKNLQKYTEITRKLSQAEVDAATARDLAATGKAVVVVTCNIHSNEIASSQMTMELVYKLAGENSPEVNDILANVILVLVPSVNPDGQIMEVEWYNKYKGTEFEGSDLPYIYHWYAGHDDNRDWFRISLKETELLTREIYHKWFPQILVDEHQMGSNDDRFFIPPFQDPPTPGLHPLIWRSINLIGSRIAYDLERRNYAGVASRGYFTGWWIGSVDDSAWFHNVAGILFEGASVRLATPVYMEPEEIASAESQHNEERVFSPHPWKGGWWRLRDIMNYDLYGTLSVLSTAARYREDFLYGSYLMASENIRRGETEAPYAYVIPREQWDLLAAEKFVAALLKSNIRVFRLTHPIKVGDLVFNKGSFYVPLAQPYRAFVKNIFENQRYPDLRRSPKSDPELPYDMAAWTLPLAMGVKTYAVKEPVKAEMDPLTAAAIGVKQLPETLETYVILDARFNNSFMAAAFLLQKGVQVWRNVSWNACSSGSFITRKSEAEAILRSLGAEVPLIVDSRPEVPLDQLRPLRRFKVALFQNYGHNMSAGWLRYVLDEYRFPYETIHNQDFLSKDFLERYDAIVFTGASESEIESGKPPKKWERYATPLPPEYSGGIGEKGEKLLQEFVRRGKTLVFMDDSCNYAINKFKLPLTNIMEDEENPVVCPGSFLAVELKESGLTAGMEKSGVVFFRRNPVFETDLPPSVKEERRTPMVFAGRDLLVSGWLEGENELVYKPLVVDYQKEKGRIILIGPDVIHRTHSEGTYKIMFNSLFSAAEKR